jgi:hypothetical protein
VLLDAAVAPDGSVDALETRLPGSHPPGSSLLWVPPVLILLAALFVIAVGVRPLRSLRNLDAGVLAAGFTLSALLLDARLVAAYVYAGIACLAYLAVRCAQVGFGGPVHADVAEPLYRRVFPGADATRLLRIATAATLLGGLIVTVTSTGASDVAFAGLAGATKLNHGELPYGQLTSELVHGDTYPLLTYVLYMPFAAISPVRDSFDSWDGALWLNATALLAGAAVLYRLAGRGRREAGVPMILAWLAFPPVLLAASSGTNDVPTAVFAAAALALFARPALSAGALALAGLTKVAPALALALWLPRLRGRTLVVACAAVAFPVALTLVALLVVGDGGGLRDSWNSIRFQFERGSWYSLWQQTGTRSVQPVFQAATVAFALVAAFEIWRQGPGAIGIRRAAALAGAVLALFQIAANYWNYAYLAWLLPFILVALLPPVAGAGPPALPRSRPLARRAP